MNKETEELARYQNSPECWEKTKEEVKESLLEWIPKNLSPRKTVNKFHTSYGLKHMFESATGHYCTNGEFKAAMLLCGYEPADKYRLNWCYRISEKSLALRTLNAHL